MNFIKKNLCLILLLILLNIFPILALAQAGTGGTICDPATSGKICNPINVNSINDFIHLINKLIVFPYRVFI